MEENSTIEKLKAQRDRFIAFAFAGGDLLIEADRNDLITYSTGAGEAIHGFSDGRMMGRRLMDFVHPKDSQTLADSLLKLRSTGRLDQLTLTLVGEDGIMSRMRMSGISLPQFPGTYHLVLSRTPTVAASNSVKAATTTDYKADFTQMVRQRLNEGNRQGHDYTLTMFDLSGTDFSTIEPVLGQNYLSTLFNTLEECSVRGVSATPLSEHAFGVIHDHATPGDEIRQRVSSLSHKFADKSGKPAPVKMNAATLALEDSKLSEAEIDKALSFIVDGFLRDSAKFSLTSLSEGANVALNDMLNRVRNFRGMVKEGKKLAFLFQPIVNLQTGAVLKYEAFCRLTHNGHFFAPAQFIPFATDVGLIGEFDLITVTKAVKMLRTPGEVSALAILSVNVSGQSLGNPAFYHALLNLLGENRQIAGRLILEVTDCANIYNLDEAKRLLTRIRALGVRVSLDDFGSSGAAFDLLRFLPVDFAKIDPSYIHDARDPKGRAVLKAVTGLCHDLGIITVGECVEDAEQMRILREVNVDYAQGYYFAHPQPDGAKRVRYFKEHIQRAMPVAPELAVVNG